MEIDLTHDELTFLRGFRVKLQDLYDAWNKLSPVESAKSFNGIETTLSVYQADMLIGIINKLDSKT